MMVILIVFFPLHRQFEEVQGRLEAAVEQASVPLALMPDIQVLF